MEILGNPMEILVLCDSPSVRGGGHGGGVEAVIVRTVGTSGAHTVAPQTPVQIKLQLMELRRKMGRG